MLHALSAHLARSGLVIAVAGTALTLATGQALAVGGWTVASAPPTRQNATLTGVATVSDSDAWAVGFRNGSAFTNIGAKVLIDNWNGTAWSQVATPATPQNTALLNAVSASSAADAWAVGRTQNNKSNFEALALHWNGTAWSVSPSFTAALNAYAVGVADISPTDAYAVGNNSSIPRGHLAHWDGTTWSSVTVPVPPNAPTNTTLEAISADGPNDVWAVGADTVPGTTTQQTLTLNWNGTAWTTVASPNVGSDRVGAVATNPGAAIVWAVGGSGTSGSFNPLVLQNG